MPLSVIHEGKVLDFRYKKQNEFICAFYIGDICLGQIFKMRRSWSAVPNSACELAPFDGYKTRVDAAEMLIKVWRHNRKPCWDGTGLPLAGTVCEVSVCGCNWLPCEVIYINDIHQFAVLIFTHPESTNKPSIHYLNTTKFHLSK